MDMYTFLVLLIISLQTQCEREHLMRFLTTCEKNLTENGQYDVQFDGDELYYVNPLTYDLMPRLPDFFQHYIPNHIAGEVYVAIGTCKYNIPRFIKGEQSPPESIVPPESQVYPKQLEELGVPNTLICLVSDFHPTPVYITWTRNDKPVDQRTISQTKYYSNKDFSFRLFSYLSFTPQDGDIYSCTVEHISLQEPVTRFWTVKLHTDHQVAETAVCVCGVILGLMGAATGVWLIIKANKQAWKN